ncbi:hypothetical protein N7474_003537 [Penicillium riverlandense]|uniref:uncharacterized protein n=1 Tax=Penicillium riverlandense TaxID=1903569 RepID=UPI0025474DEA|nr:uncharacterized protein N7474_003537 [Penicillium riverlandense]KAJ5826399.1 hypothetical protein N7474_003537 [Penicillium riverlandense]
MGSSLIWPNAEIPRSARQTKYSDAQTANADIQYGLMSDKWRSDHFARPRVDMQGRQEGGERRIWWIAASVDPAGSTGRNAVTGKTASQSS